MGSEFSYRLSESANHDVDETVFHLTFEFHDPAAASKFLKGLEEALGTLMLFSESGELVREKSLASKNVRKKPFGAYLLYYMPKPEGKLIYVLRVVHQKQRREKIVNNLGV